MREERIQISVSQKFTNDYADLSVNWGNYITVKSTVSIQQLQSPVVCCTFTDLSNSGISQRGASDVANRETCSKMSAIIIK